MIEITKSSTEFLWKPLLESAAQTIVGAISTYSVGKLLSKFYASNRYEGGMDLWLRGIRACKIAEGDSITIDGLISPFAQLFPGDPGMNARRWNSLYSFPGRISSAEYQALEFFAGSDAALRIGSLNGESIVGIYNRYGFIGEGIIGVAPTQLLKKRIPDIFHPEFVGIRAQIGGILSKCPSQHAFVAQSIAASANIVIDAKLYKKLWYLQITSITPCSSPKDQSNSLLGSSWVATQSASHQYVTQYGYFSDPQEKQECNSRLLQSKAWRKACVYFDDIACPSKSLSFKGNFL